MAKATGKSIYHNMFHRFNLSIIPNTKRDNHANTNATMRFSFKAMKKMASMDIPKAISIIKNLSGMILCFPSEWLIQKTMEYAIGAESPRQQVSTLMTGLKYRIPPRIIEAMNHKAHHRLFVFMSFLCLTNLIMPISDSPSGFHPFPKSKRQDKIHTERIVA